MRYRVVVAVLLLGPAIDVGSDTSKLRSNGTPLEVGQATTGDLPAARSCHTLIDVPERGGVLMFGGSVFCGKELVPDSGFWRWDGARWRRLPGAFASRREDALLAYDPRRRVLILTGGRAGDRAYSGTWESDGRTWTRTASESGDVPMALEHSAVAFDSVRGRVVVFGGGSRRDRRPHAEHWEWDGRVWQQRNVNGPAARVGHSMTWSRSHEAVLLYGGFGESGSFRDLWKWDGSQWSMLDSLGPTYTEGAALMESDAGPIVVGSGLASDPPWQRQLRVWLRRDGRWKPLGGPGPHGSVGMGMAWDTKHRQVVLFGGAVPGEAPSADTWVFGAGGWVKQPP